MQKSYFKGPGPQFGEQSLALLVGKGFSLELTFVTRWWVWSNQMASRNYRIERATQC